MIISTEKAVEQFAAGGKSRACIRNKEYYDYQRRDKSKYLLAVPESV